MKQRTINQKDLTFECWMVQFWGLDHCTTCEYKDKRVCGGMEIRKTGKNKIPRLRGILFFKLPA